MPATGNEAVERNSSADRDRRTRGRMDVALDRGVDQVEIAEVRESVCIVTAAGSGQSIAREGQRAANTVDQSARGVGDGLGEGEHVVGRVNLASIKIDRWNFNKPRATKDVLVC